MIYEEAIKHCVIMAYEEAIKELEQIPSHIGADCDGYEKRAISIAIEALEKQVPKKPLHLHKNYYCPVCKEDGWMLWDDAEPNDFDNFCCKCGQAIDWEQR